MAKLFCRWPLHYVRYITGTVKSRCFYSNLPNFKVKRPYCLLRKFKCQINHTNLKNSNSLKRSKFSYKPVNRLYYHDPWYTDSSWKQKFINYEGEWPLVYSVDYTAFPTQNFRQFWTKIVVFSEKFRWVVRNHVIGNSDGDVTCCSICPIHLVTKKNFSA